jgi:hypothetical protein
MKHTKENKTDRKVPKSNSTCAPYNKFWMKKSQNLPVWLSKMVLAQQNGFGPAKWFWPSIFAQHAEAGDRHSKA